jgi:hypothetical protein
MAKHRRRSRHKLVRGLFVFGGAALVLAAFFLFMHDSDVRVAGDEFTAGDPPTAFFVWSLVSIVLAAACFLTAIFYHREHRRW